MIAPSSPLPFTAIVGQKEMKLALLLCVISPGIGGLLVRGEKGTGKSTTIRALRGLLPLQSVVKGCVFGCDPDSPSSWCYKCRQRAKEGSLQRESRVMPFVELPLNATQDRVLGGIDISKSLKFGRPMFQPGLLARANRGILYIDEINLLERHLLNGMLDAAASGLNRVEREGISIVHPSSFSIIGSMNPEEGELDPQILDRFGLCVEVKGEEDLEKRTEILRLFDLLDQGTGLLPNGDTKNKEVEELKLKLEEATSRLKEVEITEDKRRFIGELSISRGCLSLRADLTLERASKALSALRGKREVSTDEILEVAPLVYQHRAKAHPNTQENGKSHPNGDNPHNNKGEREDRDASRDRRQGPSHLPQKEHKGSDRHAFREGIDEESSAHDGAKAPEEKVFDVGSPFNVKAIAGPKDRAKRYGHGKRTPTFVFGGRGRKIGPTCSRGSYVDISFDATLRAAAPRQRYRSKGKPSHGLLIHIEPQDLRFKQRKGTSSNLLVFVVDASGSMGARSRMVASKGAIMSLLLDAYKKRDKVAMISFRGSDAKTVLPPTSSVELAGRHLKGLPTGGKTPLSKALLRAHTLVTSALLKDPLLRPIILLITDGRANQTLSTTLGPVEELEVVAEAVSRDPRTKFIVVDTEDALSLRLGIPRLLAKRLGAAYFKIEDLKADHLISVLDLK